MIKKQLNIDDISKELYNLLLEEMGNQNPNFSYFDDWKITFSVKENEQIDIIDALKGNE